MSEPLVLALLSDLAAGPAIAAGFEEEGVPVTLSQARGAADVLAREAAQTAVLGIGIGADGERLVLVLAGAPGSPYLEASAGEARRFAHNAARIAARRPLALG